VEIEGADDRFGVELCARWLLADHLAREGGLLIHGVAAGERGRTALFTGPSGAGKSTLGAYARQAGLQVLSDELVAVRPLSHGFEAVGTPWHGGRPDRAVLAAVGTLGWAGEPRAESLSPSDLIRTLIGNVYLSDAEASGRAGAFRAVTSVANAVKTVKLWFAQDPSVGDAIRSVLR
jgi:hypothetical protein